MSPEHRLLRHFLAALAYRTQKALRDAPPDFGAFRAAPRTRTPQELIRHMSGVMNYALGIITSPRPQLETLPTFADEIARFHALLADIATALAEAATLEDGVPERLLQGPFADAMTHAGQLAMLRRLAGSPVPPENFFDAAVSGDNVGPHQPEPQSPDPDWPEAPPLWW